MRKISSMVAVMLVVLALAPGVVEANGNGGHGKWHRENHSFKKHQRTVHKTVSGSVVSVSSSGFTLKTKDNVTYTVNIQSSTQIKKPLNVTIKLSDIKVNDNVWVKGKFTDMTIAAKSVTVTPPNTHPAKVAGMVTGVSGNTVTLQTNNSGVISSVSVKTDSNTEVKKSDGTTGTMANVTVGSKVKVKGLWDELTNVMNALKVRVK